MIDKFSRYQPGLTLIQMFPQNGMVCSCGCGVQLTGKKKRWASMLCSNKAYAEFSIFKGNSSAIRKALFAIDKGFCRSCGAFDNDWEADHIIPVHQGGGGCGIENYQTLCADCHKMKTKKDMFRNAPHLLHSLQ